METNTVKSLARIALYSVMLIALIIVLDVFMLI